MTETEADEHWTYRRWAEIDYRPALATPEPRLLLPWLQTHKRVLDVGCNRGKASIYLAAQGADVTGVDLNPDAIATARELAAATASAGSMTFRVQDVVEPIQDLDYDVVLLIRVLTCFPTLGNWQRLLEAAHRALRPGGLLYVHDFLISEWSEVYGPRYRTGERTYGRWGNFMVHDSDDRELFVAHHHTDEDVARLTEAYDVLHFEKRRGLSMSGNEVTMFELLCQKPGQ